VGSELGVSDEKILALKEYDTSPLYDEEERVALRRWGRITTEDLDTAKILR